MIKHCTPIQSEISRVNQSYISIIVHFLRIKSNWRLEHFVLEGMELPGSHTAEQLTDAIKECMSDWNIEELNISRITIDNASNNVKTVEQVLEWPYLPCFGHTLNLAVKAGLVIPKVQKVVSECSNIVAHFRRSSTAMYIFKEKQIILGLPEHSLIQDL